MTVRGKSKQFSHESLTLVNSKLVFHLCPVAVVLGGHIDTVAIHRLNGRILLLIYDTAGGRDNLNK